MQQNPRIPTEIKHWINGEEVSHCGAVPSQLFVNKNPATSADLCRVHLGGESEIDAAVSAARKAFESSSWRATSISERARLLKKIGDALLDQSSELAGIESLDTGKPIMETTRGDIARAAYNFHFYSGLCSHQSAESFRSDDGSLHITEREPIGVVGLITPWNLPLYLATWKLAPALAMGNTVVLKPAELTPLSAYCLGRILKDCGLPPGVVNIVQGHGANSAGQALASHPDVRALSFTGETSTGTAIMKAGADSLKKISFELGGKGASIIFQDANVERAIKISARAGMRNQGQVCLAGSRLIVHERIKDQVCEGILNELKAIKIGNPLDAQTTMGSLISMEHRERVNAFVQQAARTGARILCGGTFAEQLSEPFKNGAFYNPTLIEGVRQTDSIIQDEVFGPVLTLQTFSEPEEAISLANGTRYGLSASIWTQNIDLAQSTAAKLRFGLVWINSWFVRNLHSAFGGMKSSGIGREGGRYSLDFYSELKTTSWAQQTHPRVDQIYI